MSSNHDKTSEDSNGKKSLPPSPLASPVVSRSPTPTPNLRGTQSSIELGSRTCRKPDLRREILSPHRLLKKTNSDQVFSEGLRRGSLGSLRERLSSASSMLSLYLVSSPSKLVKNSLILALLSGFFLSLYGMLYELIKDDIARSTVTVTRGITQIVVNTLVAYLTHESFGLQRKNDIPEGTSVKTVWSLFILLFIMGGLRMCFLFASLQLVNISLVHTILNGNPIIVMIMAHFMLSASERLTWIKMLSGILLLIGIVLNTNPYQAIMDAIEENNFESAVGICLAICALLLSSLSNIVTKKIGKHFTKLQISAAIGGSIAICALAIIPLDDYFDTMNVMKKNHIFLQETFNDTVGKNESMNEISPFLKEFPLTDLSCLFEKSNETLELNLDDFENNTMISEYFISCEVESPPYFPTSPNIWTTNIVIALMGLGQQFCLIAAIQMGSPTKVTMVRSSSVLFSFLLESSNTAIPEWNQWVGALIIFSAICMNAMELAVRKKLNDLKESFLKFKAKKNSQNDGNNNMDHKDAIESKV